jgi:hypothetical protein
MMAAWLALGDFVDGVVVMESLLCGRMMLQGAELSSRQDPSSHSPPPTVYVS